ncbi:alpha/beta hydrolase [Acutalibacter muris]|uniref:alpha/beta hydrolase n=1 Tax=Acutalibacter muris TaxID=1796620 RepID=UPI001C3EB692|nr:alpha/beta hydrolase-fold protein [Acutalibacter muris]
MALIQCNFNSRSLMRTVPLQVVLPTDKIVFPGQPEAEEKPFKTLYLLHGIFGNYTDWVSGTRIQAWAQNRDLCVVMPSGDNSFYVDNRKTSALYGSFIAKDLIEFTRRSFPLSRKREDTFIGGLSMGGFGAIVNGLQHPETFGRVVGLSAALVLNEQNLNAEYTDFLMTNRGYYESVFGDLDKVLGGENDYTALAERGANREDKPRMYLACGTEDGLIAPNYQFRDKLIELGYDVTWAEGPGGHDWDFWDAYILKAMEWLPLGDVTQGISSGHVSED